MTDKREKPPVFEQRHPNGSYLGVCEICRGLYAGAILTGEKNWTAWGSTAEGVAEALQQKAGIGADKWGPRYWYAQSPAGIDIVELK